MEEIVQCSYCRDYIQYDESDYCFLPGQPNAVAIECPCCGRLIYIGSFTNS